MGQDQVLLQRKLTSASPRREFVAALYVRSSSGSSVAAHSPEQQLKVGLARIEQKGWRLGDDLIFQEAKAVTGAVPGARAELSFGDLLKAISERRMDVVVAADPDRASRNDYDAALLRMACERAGVLFETVTMGSYDFSNPYDKHRYTTDMARAQLNRDLFMVGASRGKRYAYRQGYLHTGPIPWGYRSEGPQGRTVLVEDENAKHVRRIFQLYADGWGSPAIAKRLQAEGVHTKPMKGKVRPISSVAIRDILQNPLYIGFMRWSPVLEDPSDANWWPHSRYMEGAREGWAPIIDRALWARVQKRLAAQRGRHPGRPKTRP